MASGKISSERVNFWIDPAIKDLVKSNYKMLGYKTMTLFYIDAIRQLLEKNGLSIKDHNLQQKELTTKMFREIFFNLTSTELKRAERVIKEVRTSKPIAVTIS